MSDCSSPREREDGSDYAAADVSAHTARAVLQPQTDRANTIAVTARRDGHYLKPKGEPR